VNSAATKHCVTTLCISDVYSAFFGTSSGAHTAAAAGTTSGSSSAIPVTTTTTVAALKDAGTAVTAAEQVGIATGKAAKRAASKNRYSTMLQLRYILALCSQLSSVLALV
jgi:methionine salvage enolase-phosphatase E1